MNNEAKTYAECEIRLREIASQAKKKEVSLKSALDMFDEAIELSNKAIELIDTSEFSDAELSELHSESGDENQEDSY